jgi:uncharacterized protein (DUF1330 family)
MIVSNAVYPTQEQFQALLESDFSGPVSMLNLLKYKTKAVYDDGRDSDLTGEQAYNLYGEQMREFVMARGGKFTFYGSARHLMIGAVDVLWDSVAIVKYPSKEEFIAIATAPEVAGFGVHRAAGLEGQILIATSESSFSD